MMEATITTTLLPLVTKRDLKTVFLDQKKKLLEKMKKNEKERVKS